MPLPEYLQQANDETFVVIQIESPEAVTQAEAIAAVEGVDVLFLGPGDLSILSGIPGQFDHRVIKEATDQIAAAAQAAGKHWGTIGFTPQHAAELVAQGARFVCHGADILLVKQGLESIQNQFAEVGFSFENRLAT